MKQYHIQIDGNRTSMTILPILEELLTIKIGSLPDEADAKKQVRQWLQKKADDFNKNSGEKLSQYLQKEVILFLSQEETVRSWQNWQHTTDK